MATKKTLEASTAVTAGEKLFMDEVIKKGKQEYDELFKVIHQLRRIRMMRVKARAPQSFQRLMGQGIRAPMSYSLVQTLVGIVAKNRPTYERVPRSPAEKESAQHIANISPAILHSLERAVRRPLYYLGADQAVADGRLSYKTRLTPWEGFPIRGPEESLRSYNRRTDKFLAETSQHPIRANLVDPLNFMPARDEWDVPYIIEGGRRDVRVVLNRLGMDFDENKRLSRIPEGRTYSERELPSGIGPSQEVYEIWTPENVFIRMSNDSLKLPNEFGFIPYSWGMGELTSIPDPTLEGVSSIFPFLGVEPWLNTMLTVIAAWAILGSTPIMWTARQPTQNMPPQTEIALSDIPLGRRIDLGTGGQAGFLEPPGVGREVVEFTQLILSFYEKAGITPLARGLIGTRTPGLALAGALEAATDKLGPLIWNFEQVQSDLISTFLRTVDKVIKKPVTVIGDGVVRGPFGFGKRKRFGRFVVDPKDIDGYYDIQAHVNLASLQDMISQGMHAAFMQQHRLWKRDRSMRFSGVEDPFEEGLEILKDELKESPIVREFMARQALSEEPQLDAFVKELEAQGLDLMSLITQGAVSGGGGQVRGAAPRGGGRPTGSPRRPTGPRQAAQGQQFPP